MKVAWNEKTCCHSGNCVKTLPQVFKVEDGKFVIQSENASEEQYARWSRRARQKHCRWND